MPLVQGRLEPCPNTVQRKGREEFERQVVGGDGRKWGGDLRMQVEEATWREKEQGVGEGEIRQPGALGG